MLLKAFTRIFFKLLKFLTTGHHYKSVKTWVASAALLRMLYVLLQEHGYLPKKNLEKEHVFLTGAGSGLGRILAI